jgi:hypothetical protein
MTRQPPATGGRLRRGCGKAGLKTKEQLVSLKALKVTVGSVALICLGAGAANAATSTPAATATWRQGLAGVTGATTAVTGVRTSGTTTEFAFVTNYFTHQTYERTNGKAWTKLSGPALANGETVVEAKAITASDVVAFTVGNTRTSRVLSYDKGKWAVIGKFGAPIGSATVLSPSNIWVFGATVGKALGVWHYNGKSWTRASSRRRSARTATAACSSAARPLPSRLSCCTTSRAAASSWRSRSRA